MASLITYTTKSLARSVTCILGVPHHITRHFNGKAIYLGFGRTSGALYSFLRLHTLLWRYEFSFTVTRCDALWMTWMDMGINDGGFTVHVSGICDILRIDLWLMRLFFTHLQCLIPMRPNQQCVETVTASCLNRTIVLQREVSLLQRSSLIRNRLP